MIHLGKNPHSALTISANNALMTPRDAPGGEAKSEPPVCGCNISIQMSRPAGPVAASAQPGYVGLCTGCMCMGISALVCQRCARLLQDSLTRDPRSSRRPQFAQQCRCPSGFSVLRAEAAARVRPGAVSARQPLLDIIQRTSRRSASVDRPSEPPTNPYRRELACNTRDKTAVTQVSLWAPSQLNSSEYTRELIHVCFPLNAVTRPMCCFLPLDGALDTPQRGCSPRSAHDSLRMSQLATTDILQMGGLPHCGFHDTLDSQSPVQYHYPT